MAALIIALGFGTAYRLAQVDPTIRDAVQERKHHNQFIYTDYGHRAGIPFSEDRNLTNVGGEEEGTHGLPKVFVHGPGGTRMRVSRVPVSMYH